MAYTRGAAGGGWPEDGWDGGRWLWNPVTAAVLLPRAETPASVFLPRLLLFASSPFDLWCFLLSTMFFPLCSGFVEVLLVAAWGVAFTVAGGWGARWQQLFFPLCSGSLSSVFGFLSSVSGVSFFQLFVILFSFFLWFLSPCFSGSSSKRWFCCCWQCWWWRNGSGSRGWGTVLLLLLAEAQVAAFSSMMLQRVGRRWWAEEKWQWCWQCGCVCLFQSVPVFFPPFSISFPLFLFSPFSSYSEIPPLFSLLSFPCHSFKTKKKLHLPSSLHCFGFSLLYILTVPLLVSNFSVFFPSFLSDLSSLVQTSLPPPFYAGVQQYL